MKDKTPTEILPGLFLGSIGAASNRELLIELGISHIITIANGVSPLYPSDFTYQVIDIEDAANANILEHLPGTIATI